MPLSAEALADQRRNLARFSTPGVESAYAEVGERCKLGVTGHTPRAECIQELVQVWRLLRKSAR